METKREKWREGGERKENKEEERKRQTYTYDELEEKSKVGKKERNQMKKETGELFKLHLLID